ncbi:hypothetical protein D6V39_02295 [Vibrio cholerae]|nr:hypothetical protein [Vibrio cholerae]MVB50391.1 hypothetical protein [Vibrio cholerae]
MKDMSSQFGDLKMRLKTRCLRGLGLNQVKRLFKWALMIARFSSNDNVVVGLALETQIQYQAHQALRFLKITFQDFDAQGLAMVLEMKLLGIYMFHPLGSPQLMFRLME